MNSIFHELAENALSLNRVLVIESVKRLWQCVKCLWMHIVRVLFAVHPKKLFSVEFNPGQQLYENNVSPRTIFSLDISRKTALGCLMLSGT